MNTFVEIPASINSLSKRKLLCGVGINDAKYIVNPIVDGVKLTCPYYQDWSHMITRCHSRKYKEKNPTYCNCSIVDKWLLFSNFKEWMEAQDWQGKELDKDLLVTGNKEYGPDSCLFVSHAINTLLTDRAAVRGVYPQGVDFRKDSGKYRSRCNVDGGSKTLGLFGTIQEAQVTYLKFKANIVSRVALGAEASENPALQSALLRHAKLFMDRAAHIENRMNNKLQ